MKPTWNGFKRMGREELKIVSMNNTLIFLKGCYYKGEQGSEVLSRDECRIESCFFLRWQI